MLLALFLLTCSVLGLLAAHHYLLRSERGNEARHHASLVGYDVMTVTLADLQEDFSRNHTTPRTDPGEFAYAVEDRTLQPGLKEIAVTVYYEDNLEFRLSSRLYDAK